jgi:phosphonate transport system permease protein
MSLGLLATVSGAVIGFFGSLLCAENIANPKIASAVKGFVAVVRAVPTILWVLIFAISAGLGSVAAVSGMTFHSAAFLIKSYSESIEKMDKGSIDALKSNGAGFWQIVFQAVLPSSIRPMIAWTFMRFEINFTSALAAGAASGAGGIGHDLFMAGSFYLNLRELGFIAYVIVITVIAMELISSKMVSKY